MLMNIEELVIIELDIAFYVYSTRDQDRYNTSICIQE